MYYASIRGGYARFMAVCTFAQFLDILLDIALRIWAIPRSLSKIWEEKG